jgi:poly(A) polymerase
MNLAARSRLEALLSDRKIAALLALLNGDGEEARIVGGAVRNALLGERVSDIDIATTALPETVAARAGTRNWKVAPTGIAHGTLTVVIEGEPFEVTTLRADMTTDGRRATVAYTRDFAIDAARRDFTINALSLSADGVVHDYGDGLTDIASRRVRFFGEPEQRIREDYLRILRFYRFNARYAGPEMDEAGRAACRALRSGMSILSGERVGAEMLKLLAPEAPKTLPVLQAMAEDGVLSETLGGTGQVADVVALEAAERAYDVPRDALRWLIAVAVQSPADAERIAERLRLSRRAAERIEAPFHIPPLSPHQTEIDPAIYRYGGTALTDHALVWTARGQWIGTARRLFIEKAVRRAEGWTPPPFPIKAKDFMARGLEAGPELGEALRRAEQLWLDQGLPRDQARLDWIVDRAVEG